MKSNNGRNWKDKNVYVEGCSHRGLTYTPFYGIVTGVRVKHSSYDQVIPCFTNMRE